MARGGAEGAAVWLFRRPRGAYNASYVFDSNNSARRLRVRGDGVSGGDSVRMSQARHSAGACGATGWRYAPVTARHRDRPFAPWTSRSGRGQTYS